jgi:Ala-tRNA(Pro) deacylase
MINAQGIYQKLIALLDEQQVEYKLFEHREALSYEDLAAVQQEAGFFGTEMKCMVLKADEKFLVYVTLQGRRVNFDAIKLKLAAKKVRLANPGELLEHFAAQPGCAYPFAFDAEYPIYLDPEIFKQEWLLFSPVLATRTIQVHGADLKKVFAILENKVQEVKNWNE